MNKTKTILITGSSKGIGFNLANAFLKEGHTVVISGRNPDILNAAFHTLSSRYSPTQLHAINCDVSQHEEVQNLWNAAIERFGKVDIWINNAGSCTAALDFIDIPAIEIQNTIQTNVIGSLICSQIALQGMLKQGFGQIFNMEGWGSKGEWSAGMTVYATSKRAIDYFSHALYKETRNTNIRIGTLSPGMVATDLLITSWENGKVKNWQKMKRLFLFIIDPPEVVCHFLAKRILENTKSNVRIVWMTPLRLLSRFFTPYYWKRNPIQGTSLDHLDSQ